MWYYRKVPYPELKESGRQLKSVFPIIPILVKLYGHNHKRLKDINFDLLTKLIDFLIPFKEASTKIEGEKYSTINLLVLYRCKLIKHLEIF